jgi:hypothetical protein
MMANLYQYASFGVFGDELCGWTMKQRHYMLSVCAVKVDTINERSIKVKSIMLKPAYMKNAVLGYVTPCNLAQL